MGSSDRGPADQSDRGELALRGARVRGGAIVYRLYDVGYEIDLDRVSALLEPSGAARVRPVRGEAVAIQIPNPPVTVALSTDRIAVDGRTCEAQVSARVFDFGAVSLRLEVAAPPAIDWGDFVAFGNAIDERTDLTPLFERHLSSLLTRLSAAVERPAVAPVVEDYVVFRVADATLADGTHATAQAFQDDDLVPLLIGEHKALSAAARRELLPHRFSYYQDDLTVLTWNNALIVDSPGEHANESDIQYILEFANAQLLELRVYDAILDAELPKIYDRIAAARGGWALLRRRYASVLGEIQVLVAHSTELVERVDNAIKMTDDVYLARVYLAAIDLFRGRTWRDALARKLGIMRETYGMLNGESQALRTEVLEIAIVALIVIELVLAFLRR